MRTISLIIIHCSAVKPDQTSSARQIDLWHRVRGWKSIGYHFVVRRDGTIEPGRPINQVGAHCKDHNSHSIGICYEGGLNQDGHPTDTRTHEQRIALVELLRSLKNQFPFALIVGHNTLARTTCPCFDAVTEYENICTTDE